MGQNCIRDLKTLFCLQITTFLLLNWMRGTKRSPSRALVYASLSARWSMETEPYKPAIIKSDRDSSGTVFRWRHRHRRSRITMTQLSYMNWLSDHWTTNHVSAFRCCLDVVRARLGVYFKSTSRRVTKAERAIEVSWDLSSTIYFHRVIVEERLCKWVCMKCI